MADTERSSPTVRTVRLRGAGVELVADAHGDEGDPPVVLLHGSGQTRYAWGTAAQVLAANRRYALAVDLRGHGDSEWPANGDYRMDAFAADTLAVATSLPRPPVLVGASLGGLASLVAIAENDGVEVAGALVLVDITPTLEVEGSERIRAFMRSGMGGFDRLEDAADAIAAYLPHRPRPRDLSGIRKNLRQRDDGRWYWHWDPRFMDMQEGEAGDVYSRGGFVDRERMQAAARRTTVPTLLVRGLISDIVSDASVAELLELMPHAEVVDVSDAGHMVAGDRNDAFNDAVTDFVERTLR